MSKRALLAIIVFFGMGPIGWAATIAVPGSYATIDAALEALDYNDGQDDVILIGPGIYNEQLIPKGNAGVDSVAFPTAGSVTLNAIEACIATHTDRLEIRGAFPDDPPVIRFDSSQGDPTPYGFFPGNPGDYFYSTLVMAAKDVTLRNVEIRSNTGTYAINGMASNWVFDQCVFSNGSGLEGPDWDFCDYNNNPDLNSDVNPGIGLDNEYRYSNCIIDGKDAETGDLFDLPFVWWHGYGAATPAGDAVGTGVTVDNCIFRNWGDLLFEFRSNALGGTRGGLGPVKIQDSYFFNLDEMIELRGENEDFIFNRNVVGSPKEYVLRSTARERRGVNHNLIVTNNLILGNGSLGPERMFRISLDEIVEPSDPFIGIVNNTFYNYGGEVIEISGQKEGRVSIANNIFSSTDMTLQGTAIEILNPLATVSIENNLFWNNVTDVAATPITMLSDNQFINPQFIGTEVNIPNDPPISLGEREQEFQPDPLFWDAGNRAAYDTLRPWVGDLDLDSLNYRNANVDLGAQEGPENPYDLCEVFGNCPWFTEVPTQTITPTPTFALTPSFTLTPTATYSLTPSHTPDPSDLNRDGAIDAKDLLILLSDWKKVSGP